MQDQEDMPGQSYKKQRVSVWNFVRWASTTDLEKDWCVEHVTRIGRLLGIAK